MKLQIPAFAQNPEFWYAVIAIAATSYALYTKQIDMQHAVGYFVATMATLKVATAVRAHGDATAPSDPGAKS